MLGFENDSKTIFHFKKKRNFKFFEISGFDLSFKFAGFSRLNGFNQLFLPSRVGRLLGRDCIQLSFEMCSQNPSS
jgi:hypothetical protein